MTDEPIRGYTVAVAAKRLAVTTRTIYRMIERRELETVLYRPNRGTLVTVESVERLRPLGRAVKRRPPNP